MTKFNAAPETCGACEDGRVRFMTYNVYGYKNKTANTTPDIRQPYQISLLDAYRPDIVGFQEFSKRYRTPEFICELTASGYSEVGGGALGIDGKNYTPLFYRRDTLSEVDSGYLKYDGPNDKDSKSVTWAIFEGANGTRFVAMCTHFMWNDPEIGKETANATRCDNARALLALLSDVRERHGRLPLIMGGDLNCADGRGDGEPLHILADAGLVWEQGRADGLGYAVNSVNGHGAYAVYDAEKGEFVTCPSHSDKGGDRSIDHIWSDGLNVSLFATLTDRYACLASDHCPKIADFDFTI